EASSQVRPFFDGSYSPDPDLTPSWVGAANNSASILSAPGISGITPGIQTKTFQSSAWVNSGNVSARIIPVTSSNDTFLSPGGDAGAMRLGMEAGKTYTAVAVLKMDAPLTGTL